jgi:hypothetical protein
MEFCWITCADYAGELCNEREIADAPRASLLLSEPRSIQCIHTVIIFSR